MAFPVELKAGDGVIYSNFLIHTGSNYTTKNAAYTARRPRYLQFLP